jgi:hypothetical protein
MRQIFISHFYSLIHCYSQWAVRLEYYQQDPKNAGFDEPGALQNIELYPAVKAVIAQVSYRFLSRID